MVTSAGVRSKKKAVISSHASRELISGRLHDSEPDLSFKLT